MKATIAQYYAGDSLLHRLDPRAKFVAVSALAVALFVRDSFAGLAVYAAAAAPVYGLSGVPAAWFWRAFRPLLWLVVLTFVAQVVFAPGEPFFSFGFIHLSLALVSKLATYLSLRLVVLVLIGSVLTLTTPSMRAHRRSRVAGPPAAPSARAHRRAGLMVTIALRFIPTLSRGAGHDHACATRPRRRLPSRRAARAHTARWCRSSCRCSY